MARIVVMDDLPDMRLLYRDLLSAWGHDVQAFKDAAPALTSVDFSSVDLVVIDLDMPTPGHLAIRTLRLCGYDLPIVVVSDQLIGPGDESRYLAMGAQVVFTKPIDFALFRDTITGLLANGKAFCREVYSWQDDCLPQR